MSFHSFLNSSLRNRHYCNEFSSCRNCQAERLFHFDRQDWQGWINNWLNYNPPPSEHLLLLDGKAGDHCQVMQDVFRKFCKEYQECWSVPLSGSRPCVHEISLGRYHDWRHQQNLNHPKNTAKGLQQNIRQIVSMIVLHFVYWDTVRHRVVLFWISFIGRQSVSNTLSLV